MSKLYLIRHGDAVDKQVFPLDDMCRPLRSLGWQQASALGATYGAKEICAVYASCYTRCVQTVQPLAMKLCCDVQMDEQLNPGADYDEVMCVAANYPSDPIAICTHDGGVDNTIQALRDAGIPVDGPTNSDRAGVWEIDRDENGNPTGALYTPPPDVTPPSEDNMPERADKKPYGNVTYADPGYQDDKKARYPLDTADHVKAAWSYINMAKNAAMYSSQQLADIKGRIKSAAKKFGIEINDESKSAAPRDDLVRMGSRDVGVRDGMTMVGYPVVFNKWTEINSPFEGRFLERIAPSALTKTLTERGDKVKVLFNHGMDPDIGDKPLGKPSVMRTDDNGLYVEVPLSDTSYNRDLAALLRDGAIDGMSFRFGVLSEDWEEPVRKGDLPRRTVTELRMPEFGPVTFPAYEATSVGIRSREDFAQWRGLDDEKRAAIAQIMRGADPDTPADGAAESTPPARAVTPGKIRAQAKRAHRLGKGITP